MLKFVGFLISSVLFEVCLFVCVIVFLDRLVEVSMVKFVLWWLDRLWKDRVIMVLFIFVLLVIIIGRLVFSMWVIIWNRFCIVGVWLISGSDGFVVLGEGSLVGVGLDLWLCCDSVCFVCIIRLGRLKGLGR